MKLYRLLFIGYSITVLASCSVSRQVSKDAQKILLQDSVISKGHIGISIYEPSTGKYWYNYNSEKYFIPASNVKLFTLYAGMKYLGDSLPGIKLVESEDKIVLFPTGDPTLLHPSFSKQPVFEFLSITNKLLWTGYVRQQFYPYGRGWSWDDYNESFMAERSVLPVFGNTATFSGNFNDKHYYPKIAVSIPNTSPPESDKRQYLNRYISKVKRDFNSNSFNVYYEGKKNENINIPFITSVELAFELLADTLHKKIQSPNEYSNKVSKTYIIRSQPSDSLFKPMMHNSDNFFAEQTLLMTSNESLGFFNDEKIIDSLLNSDFKDIPQKPRWVDGSGLSRYNLFTPLDFIYILEKLKNEFGWERIKNILPAGGQGTLENYFLSDIPYVYAKTGTLSNNTALSGYLVARSGKLLIFSIIVNHYPSGSNSVKTSIESYLKKVRESN